MLKHWIVEAEVVNSLLNVLKADKPDQEGIKSALDQTRNLRKPGFAASCPQLTAEHPTFMNFIVWTYLPTAGRPPSNKLGHTDLTHDYF